MCFCAVCLARLVGYNLLGCHFADTLIYALYRLVLIYGPDVHYDFRIGNIEQLCAPRIFYAQWVVRDGEHARLRAVDYILTAVEYNALRLYPREQVFIGNVLFLALIEVTRKAVL